MLPRLRLYLLFGLVLCALALSACQPIESVEPDQNNEGNAPATLEATAEQNNDNTGQVATDEAGGENLSCAEGGQTIAAYLQSDDRFGQFANLIETGGMMGTLNQEREGGFTVFAFTDEAYDALDEDARTLMDADAAELQKYVQYHIARGTLNLNEVEDGSEISTLGGAPLTVHSGADIGLNDTAVVVESHPVCNGIVYVVNEVLVTPIPEE
jgi:transforming growth factor-beta-induced protein